MDVLCEVFSHVSTCFLLVLGTLDSPQHLIVVRVIRKYSPIPKRKRKAVPSFRDRSSLTFGHSPARTCCDT